MQTNDGRAESAEDALALIKHDPPDLILLDIGLPGMDELETIRRELDTIWGWAWQSELVHPSISAYNSFTRYICTFRFFGR